ncbi:hypothetical protein BJ165DRAFT_171212 [Panaeolus papilionaceus]|nr:hypothetical protein BJ165DRAFT_171212 [Panaeolus papilionaceus]
MILLEKDILFLHQDSISICNPFIYEYVSRKQALEQYSDSAGNSDDLEYLCPRSERKLDINITRGESFGRSEEGIHHWFTGSQSSSCFERHVYLSDESREETCGEGVNMIIGTYYLEDADPFSEMSSSDPPLVPMLISEYKDVHPQSPGGYIPCNGGLYRLVYDKSGLYCRGITTSSEGKKQVRDLRIEDLHYQPEGCLMSFCPASGRVCYLDPANTIHVLNLF